ncbi:hypothetical protein AVEN_167306-1 [Araneus ventricosus]|uniref:Uncharacterized protein n=1 Tax=Araneus ventricosus TaxID=182803 RepID=A0A4Y2DC12_ARAVE|nr:hypothetical protein AVEN_167306-1 [Araneus ventricosus]
MRCKKEEKACCFAVSRVPGRAPEAAHTSPKFHTTPLRGHWAHDAGINVHQIHLHGKSSAESDCEPGTLRLRSRNPTTRPPLPYEVMPSMAEQRHQSLTPTSGYQLVEPVSV